MPYVRSSVFTDVFGATGVTGSLGSAVASGNSLIVTVFSDSYNEGGIPLTVTDNQGNTYSLDRTFLNGSGNNCGYFRCHGITNAPTNLVFNWTGGGSRYIIYGFEEHSGLANAGPTDADSIQGGGATEALEVTLTTTSVGEVIIGFLSPAGSVTPTSGIDRYPATGTGSAWLIEEDAGAAGNKPIGGTWTGFPGNSSLVAASYAIAGGGGPSIPVFQNHYRQMLSN